MKERKRIKRVPICSSDNYRESRKAYREELERNHQSVTLMLQSGIMVLPEVGEPDPETIVWGRAWGKFVKMPYRMAKSNNLIWKRV